MDFRNLKQTRTALEVHFKEKGYNPKKIQGIGYLIDKIERMQLEAKWKSFEDVWKWIDETSKTEGTKRYRSILLRQIENYDSYGLLPEGTNSRTLRSKSNYYKLAQEFRDIIDKFKNDFATQYSEGTAYSCCNVAIRLFMHIQERGTTSLSAVTRQDIESFVLDKERNHTRNSSCISNLRMFFRKCGELDEALFIKLESWLPAIQRHDKPRQYLTEAEVSELKKKLMEPDCEASLRDKAISLLFLYTGMRAGDMSNLRLGNIDLDNGSIRFIQQKTGEPIELCIPAIVGNAIYDYVTTDRHESKDDNVFITEQVPHTKITPAHVASIPGKLLLRFGIRKKGEEVGSHLFRHRIATELLGIRVPVPIISKVLGHVHPGSTNRYLNADIDNLRSCALSIEAFPLSGEVQNYV